MKAAMLRNALEWATLGVLGLAQVETARERDGGAHALNFAQAGLCFLACAAVVVYGIYLIVPQFH